MTLHLDDKETRDPKLREQEQLAQLNAQIEYAKNSSEFYKTALSNVGEINNISDLQQLPIVRKSDLLDAQSKDDPFGGLNGISLNQMKNLFLSPGPIAEPLGHQLDEHRLSRAMVGAGVTKNDRVLNCFSYHHTPAGLMFENGARKLECPVYPGGIGQRDDQIKAIKHFTLSAYIGTPDFLKMIIERADELGEDVSCIDKALVTGGPFFPALKEFYASRNINAKECYATADAGLIAYQDEGAGLVCDEEIIVEIVTPGTGDHVADGEVGEVVVTLLTNKSYPLIRFATGDLSAVLTDAQDQPRTNKRLKGWMGRADQTCKIKGMFVHPKQVAQIVKMQNLSKARLVVSNEGGKDRAELFYSADQQVDQVALINLIKEQTKITCFVTEADETILKNDGIVIEDQRDYS